MFRLSLKCRANNQISVNAYSRRNGHGDFYKPYDQIDISSKALKLELERVASLRQRKSGASSPALRSDGKPYEQENHYTYKPRKVCLDLIKKSQRGGRVGFGVSPKPKNFGYSSGQKLREQGAAVDYLFPDRQGVYCVTLTLPCGTDSAFRVVSDWSGWLINRLFQPISRDYAGSCHWFYVWEYQKRGALHLHICVAHQTQGDRIGENLVARWYALLSELSEKTGVCLFTHQKGDRCTVRSKWQSYCQPVEKSVGAYFAKYAGKKESKNSMWVNRYPVARFWGSSQSLKEVAKSLSFDWSDSQLLSSDCVESLQQRVLELLQCLEVVSSKSYSWKVELKKECEHSVISAGERWVFYLSPEDYLEFLRRCRSDDGFVEF